MLTSPFYEFTRSLFQSQLVEARDQVSEYEKREQQHKKRLVELTTRLQEMKAEGAGLKDVNTEVSDRSEKEKGEGFKHVNTDVYDRLVREKRRDLQISTRRCVY